METLGAIGGSRGGRPIVIGVFDSGLGGLSVLAALVRALPQADFIYLADSAHVPYGNKADAYITSRVLSIGRALIEQGCGLLVVACNTATATAVQDLRAANPGVTVVGIEPGIKPAAQTTRSGRIAVLATEATVRSGRLARLIRDHAAAVAVHLEPCPGWATRVETLHLEDSLFGDEVQAKIIPLLEAGVDRLVLGCTHYAFLGPLLHPLIKGRAELVDVAEAVARQTLRLAGEAALGEGRLYLQATIRPERIRAALPALGLSWLIGRIHESPRLVTI